MAQAQAAFDDAIWQGAEITFDLQRIERVAQNWIDAMKYTAPGKRLKVSA